MKMIVSDYDNTFYLNDNDIKNNIKLIKQFMNDNIFLIATGRSFFDYENVRKLYNIDCNYLIINHGATIIKDNKIIHNIVIDDNIKDELINDLKIDKSLAWFACSGIDSRVSLNNNGLTKIHVKYETKEEAKEINNFVLNKYSNSINSFLVCNCKAIEIVAKETDKANSIKFVAQLEKIATKDIYTIGDGYSDVEMIRSFNGSRMVDCVDELKQITDRKYESVSDFISDVFNNKI